MGSLPDSRPGAAHLICPVAPGLAAQLQTYFEWVQRRGSGRNVHVHAPCGREVGDDKLDAQLLQPPPKRGKLPPCRAIHACDPPTNGKAGWHSNTGHPEIADGRFS